MVRTMIPKDTDLATVVGVVVDHHEPAEMSKSGSEPVRNRKSPAKAWRLVSPETIGFNVPSPSPQAIISAACSVPRCCQGSPQEFHVETPRRASKSARWEWGRFASH